VTKPSADAHFEPNPVDCHVGRRIRTRRRDLGLSQERLGEAIDLTFQQVQKYERGANRVSASKLWEIARALNTSVSYFYEGLEGGAVPVGHAADPVQDFLLTPEGQELAASFPRIRVATLRRSVLQLVRALAAEREVVET
jgi:transcriptional regulator with XRE-family HTH domain